MIHILPRKIFFVSCSLEIKKKCRSNQSKSKNVKRIALHPHNISVCQQILLNALNACRATHLSAKRSELSSSRGMNWLARNDSLQHSWLVSVKNVYSNTNIYFLLVSPFSAPRSVNIVDGDIYLDGNIAALYWCHSTFLTSTFFHCFILVHTESNRGNILPEYKATSGAFPIWTSWAKPEDFQFNF